MSSHLRPAPNVTFAGIRNISRKPGVIPATAPARPAALQTRCRPALQARLADRPSRCQGPRGARLITSKFAGQGRARSTSSKPIPAPAATVPFVAKAVRRADVPAISRQRSWPAKCLHPFRRPHQCQSAAASPSRRPSSPVQRTGFPGVRSAARPEMRSEPRSHGLGTNDFGMAFLKIPARRRRPPARKRAKVLLSVRDSRQEGRPPKRPAIWSEWVSRCIAPAAPPPSLEGEGPAVFAIKNKVLGRPAAI